LSAAAVALRRWSSFVGSSMFMTDVLVASTL
jgi:hypothetical protein